MILFSFKVKKTYAFMIVNFLIAVQVPAIAQENKAYLNATQDPIDSLLPMLGGLSVILLFIFFLAYLFKRFSNFNNGSRLIKIVESYAIGNKEKLAIVRVENECFLIGITPGSINPIGKLESLKIKETSEVCKNNETDKSSFAPLMAKFMSGKMTTDIINSKDNFAVEKKS